MENKLDRKFKLIALILGVSLLINLLLALYANDFLKTASKDVTGSYYTNEDGRPQTGGVILSIFSDETYILFSPEIKDGELINSVISSGTWKRDENIVNLTDSLTNDKSFMVIRRHNNIVLLRSGDQNLVLIKHEDIPLMP